MSVTPNFKGLCMNCQNGGDCTFPRDPARPVWQCEEFWGGAPVPERVSLEGSSPSRTGLIPEERDWGTWIGLCKNCGNRQACQFHKPEGGIWHCDEYI